MGAGSPQLDASDEEHDGAGERFGKGLLLRRRMCSGEGSDLRLAMGVPVRGEGSDLRLAMGVPVRGERSDLRLAMGVLLRRSMGTRI